MTKHLTMVVVIIAMCDDFVFFNLLYVKYVNALGGSWLVLPV